MKPTINDKKPLAKKTAQYSAYQKGLLDIPEEIKAELAAKGLEGRWINYKRYVEDGGFHKEGWVPYKPDKINSENSFFFGNNPDGIIRRKELVLASRPTDVCDAHRELLRDRAQRQTKQARSAAKELRGMAREGNFSTRVVEDSDEE